MKWPYANSQADCLIVAYIHAYVSFKWPICKSSDYTEYTYGTCDS